MFSLDFFSNRKTPDQENLAIFLDQLSGKYRLLALVIKCTKVGSSFIMVWSQYERGRLWEGVRMVSGRIWIIAIFKLCYPEQFPNSLSFIYRMGSTLLSKIGLS
jgi:hypothetical protein